MDSEERLNYLSWYVAHFSDGDIVDVTFAFEPILSISVCPIGAPAQVVAPTTIQVGLVGIVLVGCEAGGTVLLGKRSDQDFSHMIIEERQEKLIPCAYCRFPRR